VMVVPVAAALKSEKEIEHLSALKSNLALRLQGGFCAWTIKLKAQNTIVIK
jgi:hypothetical protein